MLRIRRAATLVSTFEGDKPVVHNFLTKEMFECDARALAALAALDDWLTMDDALARLPGDVDSRTSVLRELLARDLVVVEGSPQAERDQRYRENWRWGSVAGFYHFSLRDSKFLEGEAVAERMRSYAKQTPSPPLMTSNEGLDRVVDLPAFDIDDAFLGTLHRRRTQRTFNGARLPLGALADCLFAGNGVQEVVDTGDFGRLPLGMTPSGGARNPFELYVLARRVEDLEPGIYHYSAAEHSLGFLHDALPADLPALFGNQHWIADAAAVVLLCATFERSAWKYRQPLAYRVVLMEAGAIMQNVLLAATHRGVAAAPTGALAESALDELLHLVEIEQAALLAVALGPA